MGPAEGLIIEVKAYLDDLFTTKDLGYVKYFLGLDIAYSSTSTSVTQRKYINDIITDIRMDAHFILTPLPQGVKFSSELGSPLYDPEKYRRLIGRLLYLGFIRPDLSFAVQQLSQFLQHLTDKHWTVALHVVRYLKGSLATGL
ncbi:UNVERIFIED_CONTAM: Retrovirus-related Pol polyprotein from transposon RE1 [Sesamum calycinum]|uniref:Retrovirus-related Pol polyprotein from transposon RE1 n=1 Tax=Sesamum calycinum TaxID=2727403 RepID=A0AAW2M0M4_9LAMI